MPRGKSPRKRRAPINRHFKIEHVLPAGVLVEYLAHLREPATTVDTAHAWLDGRGFAGRFSRSAVARHKRHYLAGLSSQRDAQESARMYAALASNPAYADEKMLAGALLCVEQDLLKAVFELRAQGYARPVEPGEIRDLVEVMSLALDVRKRLTKLRRRNSQDTPGPDPSRSAQWAEEIAAEVRKLLGHGGPASPDN